MIRLDSIMHRDVHFQFFATDQELNIVPQRLAVNNIKFNKNFWNSPTHSQLHIHDKGKKYQGYP
jgi:hypothetical protein